MRLLKLIVNCLNFVTMDDETKNEMMLRELENSSNYQSFVKNALPEINRAIQEMIPFKKIATKDKEYTDYNYSNRSHNVILDISDIKDDIYQIFKVEYINAFNDSYPLNYRNYSSDKLLVENPCFAGTIHIVYYPRIRLLTEEDFGEMEFASDATQVTTNEFLNLINNKGLVVGQVYCIVGMTSNRYKVATSNRTFRDATNEDGYFSADNSTDLSALGITDQMCNAVIPHIVKARIWQEVEPNMAQTELTIGLQNLASLADGSGTDYVQSEIILAQDY